jgi:hypothetical protein
MLAELIEVIRRKNMCPLDWIDNYGLQHRRRIETIYSQLERMGIERLRARTNPSFDIKFHSCWLLPSRISSTNHGMTVLNLYHLPLAESLYRRIWKQSTLSKKMRSATKLDDEDAGNQAEIES